MSAAELVEIQDALSDSHVRIEFGLAFGTQGTQTTAQVYREGRTPSGRVKWIKVGPLLMPPKPRDKRSVLIELLGSLCKETERDFTICGCGEPLIWTFEFRGSEWHCQSCGFTGGMFGSGTAAAWSPELAARHAELKAEYSVARDEREAADAKPEEQVGADV